MLSCKYVRLVSGRCFEPTALGRALIRGMIKIDEELVRYPPAPNPHPMGPQLSRMVVTRVAGASDGTIACRDAA